MYTDQLLPVKLTDEKRADLERQNAEYDIALKVHAEDLDRARLIHKEAVDPIKKRKTAAITALRDGYEPCYPKSHF